MNRRVILALFVLLAVALPFPALAQETGTIRGTVTNGTEGGGAVAGLTVTLSRFQGMNLIEEFTTEVQPDGSYAFTDLPLVAGEAYVARVIYQGIEYTGQMVLVGDEPNATVDLTVYETTNDPAAISVVSRGVIIASANPELRLVEVFEILAVDNRTDRTYVGHDGWVLRLPLPDGAAQITPQPGFDYGQPRMEQGQLVTTGPIQPGSQNAMLAYSVPYTGSETSINIGTAMPTGTLRVLVREGLFSISSPALNDGGIVNVSNDRYHVLSVDNPIVGDFVTVRIADLPPVGSTGDSGRTALYAAIGAGVGLLAAAGLVFQTLRRRERGAAGAAGATDPAAETAESLEGERVALAAELNQLDDDLVAGHIDEETYQAERDEILRDLRDITERLHSRAGSSA